MKLNTFPDRIIEIDHQDYLYFGGTAYFLPTNTEFKNILVKTFLRWAAHMAAQKCKY
jgi:hypothetical protein